VKLLLATHCVALRYSEWSMPREWGATNECATVISKSSALVTRRDEGRNSTKRYHSWGESGIRKVRLSFIVYVFNTFTQTDYISELRNYFICLPTEIKYF
jgi:hypothetical protein